MRRARTRSFRQATTLLLYCCFTAALLLLCCCFTAASLLLHCCFTAAFTHTYAHTHTHTLTYCVSQVLWMLTRRTYRWSLTRKLRGGLVCYIKVYGGVINLYTFNVHTYACYIKVYGGVIYIYIYVYNI